MVEQPFSETAFAPMCTHHGVSWFALSLIRHTRREAQAELIKAAVGDGHGFRVLEAQGWRIVRVKVVQQ